MQKRYFFIFLIILGITLSGCGGTEDKPVEEPQEQEAAALPTEASPILETDVQKLVEQRLISVDSITANGNFGSGYETFAVSVTNDHDSPVTITIPCGFVFNPPEEGKQPMMAVQEVSAEAKPGETVVLSPVTVCIDSGAGVPEAGDNYRLGALESGKLLELAQCVCTSPDALNDPMGVQFAVWRVSNPGEEGEIVDYSAEAIQTMLKQALGENLPPEMEEVLQDMMNIPGFDTADTWLEVCGIE